MATSVTVTGTFHDTAGRPARGRVSFALAQPVAEPASDVVFDTTPVDGRLDLTGHFSVTLIATDDPGLVPVNVTYRVTESITGLPARSYSIIVPLSAAGTGLDLADVTPVVPFVPAQLAQPLDADLTAVAALDSAQSGVIASDGGGWLRKTYAQLKAALGITAGDVAGLGTIATHAATDYLTPAAATATYATLLGVRPVINVVAYGADPTGVADSAAAINAAIAALPASGGFLYFPGGLYKIGSTINIGNGSIAAASTRNGVRLIGEGFGGAFSFGTSSPAVRLLWAGDTVSPMVQINGPLQGWGVENFALDGAGTAKSGLRMSSAQYGESANIAITGCDVPVLSSAVNNTVPGVTSSNNMHNKFRGFYVKPNEKPAGGTFAFFIGGSADSSANTCYDEYDHVTIVFPVTSASGSGCYGIYFQACDNVRFSNVHYPGGLGNNAGKPIFVGFDYTVHPSWPADCLVEKVDFSSSASTNGLGTGTFLNNGTPSGATPNRIEDISLTNGAPIDPSLDNLLWDARQNGPFEFPHTPGADLARATDNMALPTANGAVYIRVRDAGRISKVAYRVLTQSGNMSVAVYRNTGYGRAAAPGARLATSGAFAVPVAGYYEQSLGATIDVRAGDWIGISADNVTATFNSLLAAGADNSMGNGQQYRQATAHPLPATPSGLVATQGYNIVLAGVT